jgi:hypothetical protein
MKILSRIKALISAKKPVPKPSFKDIVTSMSAAEIIMAMVNGLKNPYTVVDMRTYGQIKMVNKRQVCYGCAATNTICAIAGELIDVSREGRCMYGGPFLMKFEAAINALRTGDITWYNFLAGPLGIQTIKRTDQYLPVLDNKYTLADLKYYELLAANQSPKELPNEND